MDSVIIARVESALTEQLNSVLDDIIASVFESVLEVEDFDLHYDVATSIREGYQADIEELAANATEEIKYGMSAYINEQSSIVAARYEEEILPLIVEVYEQDGIIDRPARNEAYANFVDSLCQDGEISEYLAANIDCNVEAL